ncbi:hypothetical protein GWK47_036824 [Chionoecetes opilio]|uniref:Uncharacterized protein n=1 Tax=Chionoecetes opilio TaxID=41210 RepID=A0A8J4YE51_CHIOP|nr:hypothetical protein GWK47_036824 [Chionoecetes opilio]
MGAWETLFQLRITIPSFLAERGSCDKGKKSDSPKILGPKTQKEPPGSFFGGRWGCCGTPPPVMASLHLTLEVEVCSPHMRQNGKPYESRCGMDRDPDQKVSKNQPERNGGKVTKEGQARPRSQELGPIFPA